MTTTECPSLQFHPSEWADHCSLQKLVLTAKDGHKYQHANYVSLTLALCQPDVTIFQWDCAYKITTQRLLKRSWKPFQSDIQPVLWPMDEDEWQMRTTSPFFRAKYQKPATYCYFQDRLRESGWFRAISSAFSSAGCWFHIYWLYGLSQKREIPETCHFHGNMIIKKMEFGSVLFGFNRKVCFSPLTPSCTHVQNMWIWTASTSNGDRLPKNRSGEFWNDLSDTCEIDHLCDLLCSASEGLSLGRLGRCRQIQKQAGSRKTYTALMGNREEDE